MAYCSCKTEVLQKLLTRDTYKKTDQSVCTWPNKLRLMISQQPNAVSIQFISYISFQVWKFMNLKMERNLKHTSNVNFYLKSIYQTLYIENIKIRIVEAGIRIEATWLTRKIVTGDVLHHLEMTTETIMIQFLSLDNREFSFSNAEPNSWYISGFAMI